MKSKSCVITIITLTVILGLVGCSTPVMKDTNVECWRHQLSEKHFSNVLTVCDAKEQANLTIYFPNPSSVPTTCRQPGLVTERHGGITTFQFEAGSCENGRTGIHLTLMCKDSPKKSLSCRFGPGTSLTDEYLFEYQKIPLK